jgi:hypothetical protein
MAVITFVKRCFIFRGDFVYIRAKRKRFEKISDIRVTGPLFIIGRVDSRYEKTVLYHLIDLLGEKQPGSYYEEELIRSPKPSFKNFFEIRVSFNC